MTTKKKVGRPPATNPKPKPKAVVAYLDAERVRQLEEIVAFTGGGRNSSRAIAAAISFHHAHLKKEWPNDFS